MGKKILSIVETAYRATLEEQDDPVLWLAHSLRTHGLEVNLLLTGEAVNYVVRGQIAAGLAFGERTQTQPPRIDLDLTRLKGAGASIYVVDEDLSALGIDREELIQGVTLVRRSAIADLLHAHERVWYW